MGARWTHSVRAVQVLAAAVMGRLYLLLRIWCWLEVVWRYLLVARYFLISSFARLSQAGDAFTYPNFQHLKFPHVHTQRQLNLLTHNLNFAQRVMVGIPVGNEHLATYGEVSRRGKDDRCGGGRCWQYWSWYSVAVFSVGCLLVWKPGSPNGHRLEPTSRFTNPSWLKIWARRLNMSDSGLSVFLIFKSENILMIYFSFPVSSNK